MGGGRGARGAGGRAGFGGRGGARPRLTSGGSGENALLAAAAMFSMMNHSLVAAPAVAFPATMALAVARLMTAVMASRLKLLLLLPQNSLAD